VLHVQHTRLPSSLHAFPTEKNLAAFHSRRTAQGVVDAVVRFLMALAETAGVVSIMPG